MNIYIDIIDKREKKIHSYFVQGDLPDPPSIHSVPGGNFALENIFQLIFLRRENLSVLKLWWFAGCCTRTGQKAWLPLPRLRLNGWIWCKYTKQSTRFKDFSAIYKIHSFQQARIFPFFESGTRFTARCFSLQATKQNIKLLNFVLWMFFCAQSVICII